MSPLIWSTDSISSNFQVREVINLLWLFLYTRKSMSMRKKHWSRIRELFFSPISATKYVTYG